MQRGIILSLLASLAAAFVPAQTPPFGPEFQVSTSGTDPSVWIQDSGNFVVVWSGVFGQRYDGAGEPQGDAFQVNTSTGGIQIYPSVSGDSAGGFVVAWEGYGQDGSGSGIEARRFDSSGAPLGDEFQVNTSSAGNQYGPSIAVSSSGGFIVVWKSGGQIYGRLYDPTGTPVGDEFQVNMNPVGPTGSGRIRSSAARRSRPLAPDLSSVEGPSVSCDSVGNFVVTWKGNGGIAARTFDSNGAPLADEFQVNAPADEKTFGQPNVRVGVSGNFVIAWARFGPLYSDVFAQRYDNAGTPQGDNFQISTTSSRHYQFYPSVGRDASDNFIVVWLYELADVPPITSVLGRQYDSTGGAEGPQFEVDTYKGYQGYPIVGMNGPGSFVVSWPNSPSNYGSGYGYGLRARLAAVPTSTPTPSETATSTNTPTNTPTSTPTQTPTSTPTQTSTPSNTPTSTPTQTATSTPTNTSTKTSTQTPTSTPSNTPTSTFTSTHTATSTPTNTSTNTATRTQTSTPTPTNTPSPPPAPVVSTIAPTSGTAMGGTAATIVGANFISGATAAIGGVSATGVTVPDSTHVAATVPALSPGTLNDVTVTNPGNLSGTLAHGWFADFLDVPQANIFHSYVETVFRAGITAGCGAGNFCVNSAVTRAQMAVFLLKAEHGPAYVPPDCAGVFGDVACPSQYANWVERLAAEGITAGCGGGNYCPNDPVTRAQMAVFLLKAEHGSSYTPPNCTGIFGDVTCPSLFANWIERLAAEGITTGCGGGNYCPNNPNTRGQMSVFLVKTFGL